jgi:hypothetical protein
MNIRYTMLIALCFMANSALLIAKGQFLAVRNDTDRSIKINYVLYLPQWKEASVTVHPGVSVVIGDAAHMTISSVTSLRGLRYFWHKAPVLDPYYLGKALKDARDYRSQKRGTTIVFYLNGKGTKIYAIAEPEFKRTMKSKIMALPVEEFTR